MDRAKNISFLMLILTKYFEFEDNEIASGIKRKKRENSIFLST